MSLTALIDAESGNLHSAQKAFERMAAETETASADIVRLTSDPDVVAQADRLVLPGDGAFPAAMAALSGSSGLLEALREAVEIRAVPFLGICVGMQLMATRGHEYHDTAGLGWIAGDVVRIAPDDVRLKIPHMGWNDLEIDMAHPVLSGVATGDHAYFVHSYHMRTAQAETRLAHCDYGGAITAIVGKDTCIGTQFHPEKSGATGLRLIANFLAWRP